MIKMINRKNVIKGLQIERECVSRDCDRDCGKCDLVQDRDWLLSVYDDAIALLKEQEVIPVDTKVVGTSHGDMEVYCCSDCRTILDPAFHYCPNCGQEVKWK